MKRVISSSYVQAGTGKTYDAVGLKSAIFKLFEVALSRSEFSECDLNITSIKVSKHTRPVRYQAEVSYELTGDVLSSDDRCSKTIYDVPTNQKITEDHYLSDEQEINEIVAHFQDHYILKDNVSDVSEVWKGYETKLRNKARELSDKYDVKLKSYIWPKEPKNISGEQYISFELEIVSMDLPDGVALSWYDRHGRMWFKMQYGGRSSMPFDSVTSVGGYYPNFDLDNLFNKLESELKNHLSIFQHSADVLVSIATYSPELEQWADNFIEKYQSQYPGLSYTVNHDRYTCISDIEIMVDPDVSVSSDIDWSAMRDDPNYFKKLNRSLLGKLKRKFNTDSGDDNYRNDSAELLTL